jgi:hypothetical protein
VRRRRWQREVEGEEEEKRVAAQVEVGAVGGCSAVEVLGRGGGG